jgi:cation transport ATPase
LEKIKELQAKGEFVAMTRDGVNDATTLAQVDIGAAVRCHTGILQERGLDVTATLKIFLTSSYWVKRLFQ